jgi:hypothetical protein
VKLSHILVHEKVWTFVVLIKGSVQLARKKPFLAVTKKDVIGRIGRKKAFLGSFSGMPATGLC